MICTRLPGIPVPKYLPKSSVDGKQIFISFCCFSNTFKRCRFRIFRSQLELEIFRQLQLTRVERIQDATSSGSTSDQTSSSYQRHLSTTSGTSSGFPSGTSSSSTCTPNASPAETAGRRRLPGLTFPKPPSLGAYCRTRYIRATFSYTF